MTEKLLDSVRILQNNCISLKTYAHTQGEALSVLLSRVENVLEDLDDKQASELYEILQPLHSVVQPRSAEVISTFLSKDGHRALVEVVIKSVRHHPSMRDSVRDLPRIRLERDFKRAQKALARMQKMSEAETDDEDENRRKKAKKISNNESDSRSNGDDGDS